MTNAQEIRRKRQAAHKKALSPSLSAAETMTILLSALLLWFVLRDPRASADAARESLLLVARSVIPALFPFLVLSALLVACGIPERVARLLARPMRLLFGVSGAGAVAILLGAFCGFPVGAQTVAGLYQTGAILARERERLLILSNGPSFAFLYAAVGAGFFGDPSFGLLLYGAGILSTLLIGLALRLILGVCGEDAPFARDPHPSSLSETVTGAVTAACRSMLSVAGFVVFFGVLSVALTALLSALHAPPALSRLLAGLLELSSGTKNAAEAVDGLCGRVLCGFFAGWGGLCAHLQVIATVERPLPSGVRGGAPEMGTLSFRSYFLCKMLCGLLCALFVRLFA